MAHFDTTTGYVHYVPSVKIVEQELNLEKLLVVSMQMLKEIVLKENKDQKYMSFDLETSSLDPEKGEIVGFSFSFNGTKGYYVPLGHITFSNLPKASGRKEISENLDRKEALQIIFDLLIKMKKVFFWNFRFDARYMEYAGFDMSKVNYFDVQGAIWLADTNYKMPSLKWAERHFLGWIASTFEEALGSNEDWRYVEPEAAAQYAAVDALGTYQLAKVSVRYYLEAKLVGKIDNKILYPLMKYEDTLLKIDCDYLDLLLIEDNELIAKLEKEIFAEFGYSFKLNSGKQLSDAFESIGLNTGIYVKSGYMKTSIDVIEALYERTKNETLKKIIQHKKLLKAVTSYIENLSVEARKRDGKVRFNYYSCRVPTGRLACGSDKKNTYFFHGNIQSAIKPKSIKWNCREAKFGEDDEYTLLGNHFSLEEKSDKQVEGPDPVNNFRKAFIVNKDSYWVSLDFSSQELRIPANLSKEPVWTKAFIEGKDIHAETAIALFGKSDKDLRFKAKSCTSVNNRILTERGLVKAGNLKLDDKIVSIEGKLQQFKGFRDKRDCLEIELSNGVKEIVTKDHLYSTYNRGVREWKKALDLKVGDQLVVGSPKYFNSFFHKFNLGEGLKSQSYHGKFILDEDFAYVLGLGLGDGCLEYKKNIPSSWSIVTNKDNTDYVVSVLSKYKNQAIIPKEYKNYNIIQYHSRAVCKLVELLIGRAKSKHVPKEIFTSPRSVIENFLAGFMDSDGTVNSAIQFCNSNENIIRDVSLLLSYLGIPAGLIKESIKGEHNQPVCYRLCVKSGRGTELIKEFPIKIKYKKEAIMRKGGKENFGYNFDKDFTKEKYKEIGYKKGEKLYYYNKGQTKSVSQLMAETICSDLKGKFPVTVISIKERREEVLVMETKNRTYLSSMHESHNCNFGILYGMNAYSLQKRFKMASITEAEKFFNDYKKALPTLFGWVARQESRVRKSGVAYTYFGRPRRVKYYMQHLESRMRAFGYRTITNTVVQGAAADILKISLINMWSKVFSNPKYKGYCSFLSTIHDEINIEVKKDKLMEILPILIDCMVFNIPGWAVQMDVGIEVGNKWGSCFPFIYSREEGKLTPKYEEENGKDEIEELNEFETEDEEDLDD